MTQTRKTIFEKEYKKLTSEINEIIGENNLLPNIDEIDLIDIFLIFDIYFKNCNENNYINLIDDLIKLKNVKIDNEKLKLLYPILYNFIIFIKTLN